MHRNLRMKNFKLKLRATMSCTCCADFVGICFGGQVELVAFEEANDV